MGSSRDNLRGSRDDSGSKDKIITSQSKEDAEDSFNDTGMDRRKPSLKDDITSDGPKNVDLLISTGPDATPGGLVATSETAWLGSDRRGSQQQPVYSTSCGLYHEEHDNDRNQDSKESEDEKEEVDDEAKDEDSKKFDQEDPSKLSGDDLDDLSDDKDELKVELDEDNEGRDGDKNRPMQEKKE